MRELEVTTTIAAGRGAVWAQLADLPGISVWNPGVRSAAWTSATREGVGAGRRCATAVGGLDEVVDVWDDDERLVLRVTGDGPLALLFRRGTADFRLSGPDDGPTTVTLHYELHARLGRPGEALIARSLARGLQDLVDGLRDHVEARAST